MENLAKQVKILKALVIVLTIVVIAFIAIFFRLLNNNNHFKQITAERIDIVEPDGKIRMAISNRQNQHPGIIADKVLPKRDRPAGMIFFNDDGDECGGLIYDGDKKSASMTYSIDQYHNDQIMHLEYSQDNNGAKTQRSYGLKLWDKYDSFTTANLLSYVDSLQKLQDTAAYNAGIQKLKISGRLTNERLFVGKNQDGEVGLFLRDAKGRPRLKIYINQQNQPVIQTFNEKGEIITAR